MIAFLLALTALAAPPEPRPCGVPALTAAHGAPQVDREPRRLRGTVKAVRDAFGSFDTYETANFAIKWGAMTSFTQADVEALGDAFELAWATEIGAMGYPPPLQTESWKFNVYLGDTGEGTPSAEGNSGYYWYDDDGFPMIVVAGDTVSQHSWVELTAAHEFFHAIQDAAGMFAWDPRAVWWTEASAAWMEEQVYPTNRDSAYFLYWFAIRPELQLSFYEYPQDGNPEEFHQYGAFVFIKHIEENVGGTALVHDIILGTGAGGDPQQTLADWLETQGDEYDRVFSEFVGRNATWDYEHEDWYDALIDEFGGYTGDSHRPTYTLSADSDGWMEVPRFPAHTWGANYWRLRNFDGEDVLRFDGALDGEDTPRSWSVQVAVQDGDDHRRIPLALTDGVGSVTAAEVGSFDEAWLVVAPLDAMRGTRTWTYAVSFESAEEPPPEEDTGGEPVACGCATTPSGLGIGGWLVAAWSVRRRLSSKRRSIEPRSHFR